MFVRVFDGELEERVINSSLRRQNEQFGALEIGIFTPGEESRDKLVAGEIGYIVTGD